MDDQKRNNLFFFLNCSNNNNSSSSSNNNKNPKEDFSHATLFKLVLLRASIGKYRPMKNHS